MAVLKVFPGVILSILLFNRSPVNAAEPPGDQSDYSKTEYSSIFQHIPKLFAHVFDMLEENPSFLEQTSANLGISDTDNAQAPGSDQPVKVIKRETKETDYQENKKDDSFENGKEIGNFYDGDQNEYGKKIRRETDCNGGDDSDDEEDSKNVGDNDDKYRYIG